MNGIFIILFPNGQMQISCDNFFPCQQQYIKMLDKVIALSDDPQELRQWLIHYLRNRINTEPNDKIKAKLTKNINYIGERYAKTSLAL